MPEIHESVYLASGATVIGDVEVGEGSSLWTGAVVRGDLGRVRIGERTNVQDNAVVHGSTGTGTTIGSDVVIGHGAIVHCESVGDGTLVGMGAILLDGARVGRGCIIGAGALVTSGTVIPDSSLAFGSPARVVRETTDEEVAATMENAALHVRMAAEARAGSARFAELRGVWR